MRKLKYILRAIIDIDYKNMFKVTKNVSKKAHKLFITTLFDEIYCAFKYGAGYMDYQEFEFYLLNKDERKTYLTRVKNASIIKKYNNKEYMHYLSNKIEFNNKFKKYLKRNYIDLNKATLDEFKEFCKDKEYVIAKELDNCGGKGITNESTKNIKELYNKLKENKQYLVEELIIQNKKISKLNPSSVNTLRIFTFFDGKEVHILNSILKIGNSGFVDNFSSGGMYTFLNDKGKVICPAIDVNDNKISIHPVTKEKILDFEVPNFDKAIELVKNASKEIKEIQYIGWDVAILEKDACIVEGNEFPGVFQIKPSFDNGKHEGILPKYQKYIKM